jgi:hypothetical protein
MKEYVLFILIIFLTILLKINVIENFETIDETKCIDEVTREVRKTTKEEQKVIKKKKGKEKEVFLIYGKYNYLEAQEICKIYNGKLATLKQLEEAFNKGANWCVWGWLDKQYIGFPIQESYWNEVEKKHKGFCGATAGINKIKNMDPSKRFSIHCYGIKPKRTEKDLKKTLEIEKKINKMQSLDDLVKKCKINRRNQETKNIIKKKKNDIVILNFNNSNWSIYS